MTDTTTVGRGTGGSEPDFPFFQTTFERIVANVEQTIQGKDEVIRLAMVSLVAEGHILLEDVPGVGKTMLAKSLARSLGCSWSRIQFTPDLLPTDVTGVNVWDRQSGRFIFKPGAVFANVCLSDEINRASPKTQSALLECMEERQVTVDGVMMRLSVGYPSRVAELQILDRHGGHSPLEELEPVADAPSVMKLIAEARDVYVAPTLRRYIVELTDATRGHPDIYLGASPRASLYLLRAARAGAASRGRDYVTPDDIQNLALPVLGH